MISKIRFIFFVLFSFCLTTNAQADDIGQIFLIEHYSSTGKSPYTVKKFENWIKNKNLGGIIFWNGNQLHAKQFRQMLNQYRNVAQSAGRSTPLMGLDYEGKKVQKLNAKNGFTNLILPRNLGESAAHGDFELCKLHGRILSKELFSTGFNIAFSTVSDLYRPNRGSRNMFEKRAISKDPVIVSNCIKNILEGVSQESSLIFTTKHFPGLGSVNGNTDLKKSISKARTKDEELENLFPFADVIKWSNINKRQESLAMMASSASYPFLDDKLSLATESKVILQDLLTDQLHFEGLVISDSLWTGHYGEMNQKDRFIKYAVMVYSGIDMLMVASREFNKAYSFILSVYENKISEEIKNRILKETNSQSWPIFLNEFRYRIKYSSEKVGNYKVFAEKQRLNYEVFLNKPSELTLHEVKRYSLLNENRFPLIDIN